jgi:hypothetical protein
MPSGRVPVSRFILQMEADYGDRSISCILEANIRTPTTTRHPGGVSATPCRAGCQKGGALYGVYNGMGSLSPGARRPPGLFFTGNEEQLHVGEGKLCPSTFQISLAFHACSGWRNGERRFGRAGFLLGAGSIRPLGLSATGLPFRFYSFFGLGGVV